MYALVTSNTYCSIGMGGVFLACNSVSMSSAVCLRYVLVDTFGKGGFVGNQSIIVVSLVELVDVTKHF